MVFDNRDLSSIFLRDETLVIDLTESFSADGIVVGEGDWEWEWDWECVIPMGVDEGNGRACTYDGGRMVEMPGQLDGRFEGEDGETFEEGVPLYFVVRVRVRESGGRVVGEGKWEKVFNPVGSGGTGLEIVRSEWVCEGSAVGYSVTIFLISFLYLFFFSLPFPFSFLFSFSFLIFFFLSRYE